MVKVIFHLARHFPQSSSLEKTLYQQIKEGLKTSEWRDTTAYWIQRLLIGSDYKFYSKKTIDLSRDLKVHTAWFVEGYPKGNVPRLEAEIIGLFYHPDSNQFEIQFKEPEEVK